MRIGLVDVDSHNFPNLVLMKLSTWHKQQGHEVELLRPADVLNGSNLFYGYDELIGACVFDWNKSTADRLSDIGVYVGGTGTHKKDVLPEEVEHCFPDYSLYGITDTAYGFLTRGCPRHCPFCIVGDKEGLISRKVANLNEFWDGQKEIQLMDPNILACKDREDLLKQLVDCGAWVEINQGLDARMLTVPIIEMLNKIKIKMIHFAWDNPRDKTAPAGLELYSKYGKIKNSRNLAVYVLVNYWSTIEEDLYRVYWLRDHGYDPYVMVYDKQNASKEIKHLQRYVNAKQVFKSIIKSFKEYKKEAQNNEQDHRIRQTDKGSGNPLHTKSKSGNNIYPGC